MIKPISAARGVSGRALLAAGVAALTLSAIPASARVTRIEVSEVKPAFDGRVFGEVGAYELVDGVAYFEVDPNLPVNAVITNLQHAPRNERGMVEFDVDVRLLRPVDPNAGNGNLFFEPVNRGRPLSIGHFNDAQSNDLVDAEGAGNGFLMQQGYTVLLAGWQPSYPHANVPAMAIGVGSRLPQDSALRARLPIATSPDGGPVTARIAAGEAMGASGADRRIYLTYPAAHTSDAGAYLRLVGSTEPLNDGSTWRYIDDLQVAISRPEGASGAVEFVYEAKDPFVYGLALASMRDLMSYFRYDDASGGLGGVARKAIETTIAFGASQTGRTVKTLAYLFNDDEQSRKVMDGVFALVSGASLNSQNDAFATPGDKGGSFPFTYPTLFDPLSRKTDGVLMRCEVLGNCPKIIHADSGSELTFGNSLLYTDTLGNDVEMPEDVRVYLLSGTQHGPADAPEANICRNLSNPLPYSQPLRALLVALDQWIEAGVAPPASRYPRHSDGTLVSVEEAAANFPDIPGVEGKPEVLQFNVADPGSGAPVSGLRYPVFAARADADGNVVAGVRTAQLMVPLATHTGWNVPKDPGGACPATGTYAPFPATREARAVASDPRLSIEERYPTTESYVEAIRAATEELVAERLMLPDDAAQIIEDSPARYSAALRGEYAS